MDVVGGGLEAGRRLVGAGALDVDEPAGLALDPGELIDEISHPQPIDELGCEPVVALLPVFRKRHSVGRPWKCSWIVQPITLCTTTR